MPFEYHLNAGLNQSGIQTTILIQDQYGNSGPNTGHLKTGQVKVCYSDVSVIQMFFIQIPTE